MEKKSKIDFDEFCEVYTLNPDTKEKLQKEGLTDLNNILELTSKDLDHMDIKPLGQRKALTRGIQAQRKDAMKQIPGKISNVEKPDNQPVSKKGETEDTSKTFSIAPKLAEPVKQHHNKKLDTEEAKQPVKIEKPVGRVQPNSCTESEESSGTDSSIGDVLEPEEPQVGLHADTLLVYQWTASPHNQMKENEDLKLLLVGITGSGKSSSGNIILSADDANIHGKLIQYFTTAMKSEAQTLTNEVFTKTIDGRKVTVVDTPGPRNTGDKAKFISEEIINAIRQAKEEWDGYSAIVYVIKIFEKDVKMNNETKHTLKLLKKMMGPDFYKYVVFLFPYGSKFEQWKTQVKRNHPGNNIPDLTFHEFIMRDELSLEEYAIGPIIREVNGRAVLFENTQNNSEIRKEMVLNLLKKVDEIHVLQNGKKFWRGNLPVKKDGISCLSVLSVVVVIIAVLVSIWFGLDWFDL